MNNWDDPEEEHELEPELVDFKRTVTWQRVMKPSLLKRQEDISRKLCTGAHLDLEQIREAQIIYNFISKILDDPIAFFSQRKTN